MPLKVDEKKVETRAASVKYRNINVGDNVILVCGKNKFEKRIDKVKIFKTINALLLEYKANEINPKTKSKQELQETYDSFPGYKEKIKKYGLIALELK